MTRTDCRGGCYCKIEHFSSRCFLLATNPVVYKYIYVMTFPRFLDFSEDQDVRCPLQVSYINCSLLRVTDSNAFHEEKIEIVQHYCRSPEMLDA